MCLTIKVLDLKHFLTIQDNTQADHETSENSSIPIFVSKIVSFQPIMYGIFLYKYPVDGNIKTVCSANAKIQLL